MRRRLFAATLAATIIAIGTLIAGTPAVSGTTSPDWRFERRGAGKATATDVASALDGGLVVVSGTSVTDGDADILVMGLEATTGEVRWQHRIGGSETMEHASAVAVSANGETVFVVGARQDRARHEVAWVIVSLDATTGEVGWRRIDPFPFRVQPPVAVVAGGGKVFAVGRHSYASGGVVRYDSVAAAYEGGDGARLWRRRLRPGGADSDWRLVFDAAYDSTRDELDVAIEVQEERGRESLSVLALSSRTGVHAWRARWPGPRGTSDAAHPRSLLVDPSKGIAYVGGEVDEKTVVIAFATGSTNVLWHSEFGRRNEQGVHEVVLSEDGMTLYGVADEWSSVALHGYSFALRAPTGRLLWDHRVIPTSDEWDSIPAGVAVAPSGALVAGFLRSPVPCEHDPCEPSTATPDFLTGAFDPASGASSWRDVDGEDGSDWPVGIVPTAHGVAICGTFDSWGPARDVACVGYAV